MNRYLCLLAFLMSLCKDVVALNDEDLELPVLGDGLLSGFEESDNFELPEILSSSRLRTPRPEVPASVTLITADQIETWGVRTIPELMRFVPGMFVGHGDDENATSVAYHASNPSVMRRLQVLIDGRSVFQSGIAAVVWNDIPVALEDIERIEVTRGPNSASYGANSFLGVVNIITKHPQDTIGTRLMYRNGDQGIDDGFASHSWISGEAFYRLSGKINADDGFDGNRYDAENGEDILRDSHRHGSIVLTREQDWNSGWHLGIQSGFTGGHTDMRKDSFDQTYPDKHTEQGYLMSLLSRKDGEGHEYQLKSYWQYDKKKQDSYVCGSTFVFDPDLYSLYRLDSDLANVFGQEIITSFSTNEQYAEVVSGVVNGSITPGELGALLTLADASVDYEVSSDEYQLLQNALLRSFDGDFDSLSEVTCGNSDRSISEQRLDIEFQDTFRWSETLRTVSGFNFRRDQVNSYAFFKGKVNNDTYRLFGNVEWIPSDWAVVNLGATYESEDANDAVVSPRGALNVLLTKQQSLRFVYSEAVRSPDLLEQNPNYSFSVSSMTDNYLGLDDGVVYMHQWPESRNLEHEKIVSREVGYYGIFSQPAVEVDVKLYDDQLSNLISDPINLSSTYLASDTKMHLRGAESQVSWRLFPSDTLRLVASSVSADVEVDNDASLSTEELATKEAVETRLSARHSFVGNWTHVDDLWSSSLSFFWYDSLNNHLYRRLEVYVKKSFPISFSKPWVGLFWQRQIDQNELIFFNQRYSSKNIFTVQVGLTF